MLVLPVEFAQIMEEINGPSRHAKIRAIARQYIAQKLALRGTPSVETRIVSLFIRACREFLIRDSSGNAHTYEQEAHTLRSALEVLSQDEGRWFHSLMLGVDDAAESIKVLSPPSPDAVGRPGPVRIRSHSAGHALWALNQMADEFEEIARDFAKDPKNITFFYCLYRLFSREDPIGRNYLTSLPLPSADQMLAAWDILVETVNRASPTRLEPNAYDKKEIGRLIRYYQSRAPGNIA
jgi:hypothetical protein